eukprot:m.91494 g.91494  ORF g.91494 m.91494 type:complete len:74 (-) comp14909_c0_seq4:1294-1515(-)
MRFARIHPQASLSWLLSVFNYTNDYLFSCFNSILVTTDGSLPIPALMRCKEHTSADVDANTNVMPCVVDKQTS